MKPYNYNPRHPNRIKALKDRNRDPIWILIRFWSYIDVKKDSECWNWIGCKDGCGYGHISVVGKLLKAHRFSYLIHNGNYKKSIQVLHKCDNPACVNPKHLFLGTQLDNIKDMVAKNRQRGTKPGELNHASKLTNKQAKQIKKKYKPYIYSSTKLAKEYGVSHQVILSLVKGKTWKFLNK